MVFVCTQDCHLCRPCSPQRALCLQRARACVCVSRRLADLPHLTGGRARSLPQHFGPNIGIAVVDNLFGLMQVGFSLALSLSLCLSLSLSRSVCARARVRARVCECVRLRLCVSVTDPGLESDHAGKPEAVVDDGCCQLQVSVAGLPLSRSVCGCACVVCMPGVRRILEAHQGADTDQHHGVSACACVFSTPVGAALGLFLGTRLADLLERLSQRYSVQRVDGSAAVAFILAVAWIIRPR